MNIFFSIIIPFRESDNYLLECVNWCFKQEYKNFEIILLPDKNIDMSSFKELKRKVKVIPTGKVFPSRKRNIGIKYSKGNFCAFIDSDAFPERNWLKNSIKYFKNEDIAVVGGPNIPPKNDPFLNKISGMVMSNSFAVGSLAKRFKIPNKNYFTNELSSSNLIVRKSLLENAGGFDEKYLTAEDTKLCFKIKKTGKKILNTKDVKVYHHQRKWILPYLKQVNKWGVDHIHAKAFLKQFACTFSYFLTAMQVCRQPTSAFYQ